MKILEPNEQDDAKKYFQEVARVAARALCLRDKCGAIIVSNGEIVGTGYNAPPLDDMGNAKCLCEYPDSIIKKKADKTCCMHAEWRAILDALKKGKNLQGSTLYFARVDDEGKLKLSGKPYCTACSRFALDVGIAEFVLWREEGVTVYGTREYNDLSYEFHTK